MRGNTGEYDPDSLLTGAEIAQGYTYSNSERIYPDAKVKEAIIRGEHKFSEIPNIAPRRLKNGFQLKELPQQTNSREEERSI